MAISMGRQQRTRGGLGVRHRTHFVTEPVGLPGLGNPLKSVNWTLTLGAFLAYLLVITSYRLPIGDVVIVAALAGLLLDPDQIWMPSPVRWFGAFTIWVVATSFASPFPDAVSQRLLDIIKLWLIVFIAASALRNAGAVRVGVLFFLLCFLLFPVRGGMITYFVFGEATFGRAQWIQIYRNPNDFAAMALLQLSIAGALLITEPKGWPRWIARVGAFALPMLVLMTQSRGGFLGLMVFVAIVLKGAKRRGVVVLQLLALAGVLVAVSPRGVWERVGGLKSVTSTETLAEADEEGSAEQRFMIWHVAMDIIGDNKFIGVGINAYKDAHKKYAGNRTDYRIARGKRDTHSMYLNVLAETGFPGLFLFLGIIGSVLVKVRNVRRQCGRAREKQARHLLLLEAGLAAFLTAAIFGSWAYIAHLHLHLIIMYATAVMYESEEANS